MKKYSIQFEAGEGRDVEGAVNFLICPDIPDLYAEIAVPEGASDDYGYLALKAEIIRQAAAAGIDREELSFWYDGQEQYLAPDAAAGCHPSEEENARFVTKDRLGQPCPDNWEDIVSFLSERVSDELAALGPCAFTKEDPHSLSEDGQAAVDAVLCFYKNGDYSDCPAPVFK